MSSSSLRNGGQNAHLFLFNRHFSSPFSNRPRSDAFSSKLRAFPTVRASSSSSSSNPSSVARNGFMGWYPGMIESRPVPTKSLTAGAIFTVADVSSQAFYGPFMTVVFFSLNAALQGETGSEILARLKRDLVPTFVSGLVYWPMCDFITFKFAPGRLQPLASNSFSFLWTIYITYMASLKKASIEVTSPTS